VTSASAPFSITVIGCSGTYSSTDVACSSYLLRTETTSVLLDAGPGSSMELQRHIELGDLDAIIISHEHPDHWTELPILYHAYRYGIERSDVPVYGTGGARKLLESVVPESTSTAFSWTTIDSQSAITIGDIDFVFSETDHPVETLAILARSGDTTIGYSADTGPGWSPESFGAEIDVFVYETTLPDDLEDRGIPHVSGREAGTRATAAGIGHLVLTHVPPGYDPQDRRKSVETEFSGQISVAKPGLQIISATS